MKNIECREVIVTTLEVRGTGVENDPIRRITQVYEKTGELIAETDPLKNRYTEEDMRQFARHCLTHITNVVGITIEAVKEWDKTNF